MNVQSSTWQRRARWILLCACLTTAVVQVRAAAQALDLPPEVRLNPGLEFAAAVLWGCGFAVGAYRLAVSAAGALRLGAGLCVLCVDYTAAGLWLFAGADYDRGRLPLIVAAAVCLTVSLWITIQRPALRRRRERTHQMEEAS